MQAEQFFLSRVAAWTDIPGGLIAIGITYCCLFGRNLQLSILRLQEGAKSRGGSARTRVRRVRLWARAPPNSIITIYNILM